MTEMPPVALIAGGTATRLRPLTETIPKSMVAVAGCPFIFHQLRLLRREAVKRVVICAGYFGERIQASVGDGAQFGVEVAYSFDGPRLLGTGGAIKKALALLGEDFLLLYGDSYLDIPFRPVVETFRGCGCLGLMTVFRNEGRWDASNIEFADGAIVRYDKKNHTPAMRHIDYGLGVLKAEALQAWPDDEAFDLEQVYQQLIAKKQLAGFEVTQRFYEIGSFAGLAETEAYLRQHAV